MKLLILGGTRFLGRHLALAALARDHEVTLFNRGNHAPPAPSVIETIHGDRRSDLAKLRGRRWDAVIDTSGYLPRQVKAAAETLADSLDRYVFISSQSVYADFSQHGLDEAAPLAALPPELLERANAIDSTDASDYGAMYGGLKALCEQAAEEIMPGRVLVVRPGLIVGPHDNTDRFTYWVARVARGSEVLAPGRPDRSVQFIDARDLAEWTIKMIEQRAAGTFNVNGAPNSATMRDVLEGCKSVSGSDASFTWVAQAFLQQQKVLFWSDLPLYLPEEDAPQLNGFMFVAVDKAVEAGLCFRSLNETIRDTLNWFRTERGAEELKAGIDTEREQTLLRKWHESWISH